MAFSTFGSARMRSTMSWQAGQPGLLKNSTVKSALTPYSVRIRPFRSVNGKSAAGVPMRFSEHILRV